MRACVGVFVKWFLSLGKQKMREFVCQRLNRLLVSKQRCKHFLIQRKFSHRKYLCWIFVQHHNKKKKQKNKIFHWILIWEFSIFNNNSLKCMDKWIYVRNWIELIKRNAAIVLTSIHYSLQWIWKHPLLRLMHEISWVGCQPTVHRFFMLDTRINALFWCISQRCSNFCLDFQKLLPQKALTFAVVHSLYLNELESLGLVVVLLTDSR